MQSVEKNCTKKNNFFEHNCQGFISIFACLLNLLLMLITCDIKSNSSLIVSLSTCRDDAITVFLVRSSYQFGFFLFLSEMVVEDATANELQSKKAAKKLAAKAEKAAKVKSKF